MQKRRGSLLLTIVVFGLRGSSHGLSSRSTITQDIAAGCGAIRGRVTDQRSVPVSGVRVYAMVADHPPRARSTDISATTDDRGVFFLGCAEPGRSGVYTLKEDEYYPDTLLTPFIDSRFVTAVDVVSRQVTRGVEVHLPPKAGRLAIRVVDSNTRQRIEGATITLCRVISPRDCRVMNANLTSAGYSQLLPAFAYTVKGSAPQHQDRYYGKDGLKKRAEVIRLSPEITKALVIPLDLRRN